jgi:hypothetical protein
MRKYVRIAMTALSLTACVLLMALWVRSYWRLDALQIGRKIVIAGCFSSQGQLGIVKRWPYSDWNGRLLYLSRSIDGEKRRQNRSQFYMTPLGGDFWAGVPHWFMVLSSALIAGMPWWRWRFSLGTLLIATTLIAVVLGAIIWAAR